MPFQDGYLLPSLPFSTVQIVGSSPTKGILFVAENGELREEVKKMSEEKFHVIKMNDKEYKKYVKSISWQDREALHELDDVYSSMNNLLNDLQDKVRHAGDIVESDIVNSNLYNILEHDLNLVSLNTAMFDADSFCEVVRKADKHVNDCLNED